MTDRELLELAAKAAGYSASHPWNAERIAVDTTNLGLCIPGVSTWWNPLSDKGYALGLAIKLRMGIHYETQFLDGKDVEIVEVYHSHNEEDRSCKCVTEEIGDNAGAALMRAITRAAAEIQLQKERNET